jgi:hypothetical protein
MHMVNEEIWEEPKYKILTRFLFETILYLLFLHLLEWCQVEMVQNGLRLLTSQWILHSTVSIGSHNYSLSVIKSVSGFQKY